MCHLRNIILISLLSFEVSSWQGILLSTTHTGTYVYVPGNEHAILQKVDVASLEILALTNAVQLKGLVYYIGERITIFDPMTNETTDVRISTGKRYTAATGVNDSIIACERNSCDQFHPFTRKWTAIAQLHFDIEDTEMITLQNKAYSFGGTRWQKQQKKWSIESTVQMYDEETWITRTPMPRPTYGHAAVAIDSDRALMCGGYVTGVPTAQCYVYSALNDSWTNAPPMAVECALRCHMVFVDGNIMFSVAFRISSVLKVKCTYLAVLRHF